MEKLFCNSAGGFGTRPYNFLGKFPPFSSSLPTAHYPLYEKYHPSSDGWYRFYITQIYFFPPLTVFSFSTTSWAPPSTIEVADTSVSFALR